MTPALYAFTPQGLALALRIASLYRGTVYVPVNLVAANPARIPSEAAEASGMVGTSEKAAASDRAAALAEATASGVGLPALHSFSSLSECLSTSFHSFPFHIFIGACGIAVRAIAPHLGHKRSDPAVLVVDHAARHVISLLSGHAGGANAFAAELAAAIGAVPVITTATDIETLPAFDVLARRMGLALGNEAAVKSVSAALLRGDCIELYDPFDLCGLAAEAKLLSGHVCFTGAPRADAVSVVVTPQSIHYEEHPHTLFLHPSCITAGIGCRRGTSCDEIMQALRSAFARTPYATGSLRSLASIDAKADERGLVLAAEALGVPFHTFAPHDLQQYACESVSPKAQAIFGVRCVCEASALAAGRASADNCRLLLAKHVFGNVTVAFAAHAAFPPALFL